MSIFQILCALFSYSSKDPHIYTELKRLSPYSGGAKASPVEIVQTLYEFTKDLEALKTVVANLRSKINPKKQLFAEPTQIDDYLNSYFKGFK
jgi:hypothetical protein